MRQLNKLLQAWIINMQMFCNIYHFDCQCQLFLTLKYIPGLSIFVYAGNEERKNGALDVV